MSQKILITKTVLSAYLLKHSVAQASEYFGCSKSVIYALCRDYGIPLNGSKVPMDVLTECLRVCSMLTCKQAYELYGEPYGIKDRAFRYLIKRHGGCFKVPPKSVYSKNLPKSGDHGYYRAPIDEDHLRANAHLYTCKEYYEKFKPPCARTTLFYHSKELGVRFKKSTDVGPFIVKLGKECKRTGKTWEEFRVLLTERFPGVSISQGQHLLYSNGIHLKATPRSYELSKIDRKIIFLLYPYIGSSCREYLNKKRPVTAIRNWASRHSISKVRCSFSHGDYLYYEYKGKRFKTKESMVECILNGAGVSLEETGYNKS